MYVQGTIRNYKDEVKDVNWEKKMVFIRDQNYYI